MRHVPGIPHNINICVCGNCRDTRRRIAIFGALRRAVAIAREWDFRADDVDLDIAHGGAGWTEFTTVADEIRYAIRAALREEA